MRVAIVELYEHWEIVHFLRSALRAHTLSYYLSAEVASHPMLDGLGGVHVLPAGGGRDTATHAVVADQTNLDVVIVCTRNVDHRPWRPLSALRIPAVLLLHDAAYGFAPAPSRLNDIGSRLRRWRWRLAGSWSRRLLLGGGPWSAFATSAPGGGAYLSASGEVRPCLVAPYACVDAEGRPRSDAGARDTDVLRIAVPGSVDANHRAYAPVLSALADWRARRLELSLPGALRGRDAANTAAAFEALGNDYLSVTTRRTSPELDYATVLAKADLLLAPVRPDVYYATLREHVGVTKGLGSLDDQIRYGKPAIVPEGIPTWPQLAPATRRYADGEALRALLEDYVLSSDRSCFEAFSPSRVADRWGRFLREVTGLMDG